jgi:hypothetical protein
MPGMFAPLATGKLDEWKTWVAELNGPRKAEFEDMNARHALSEHRAYLQPMPDESSAVLVVYEGPGADNFLPSVMASDHEFDRWFVSNVAELHGMDSTGPMPVMAQRMI